MGGIFRHNSFGMMLGLALVLGACGGSTTGSDAGVQDAMASDSALADGQPDAGVADGALQDGGSGADAGGDAASTCIPAATPGPSSHNAGQECLACHANMSGNRRFTVAGTVYASASGGTGVGGATVRLVPASGSPIDIVTGTNGNFFTTQTVSFPVTVLVSKCPDTAPMVQQVTQGGCNASGCHGQGNRIHLP